MKIRKTKQAERGVYKYTYQVRAENGEYVTETVVLRPGENGVTEMDIKRLHALDDSEVYYNCKNLRSERSAEEKERIKAFEKEYVQKFKLQHGYEPNKDAIKDAVSEAFPSNYNLSLDFAFENEIDEDKSSVIAATAVPFDDKFEWSEEMEDIRELLSDKQREVLDLKFIDGYTQKEIADMLGVTKMAITKRLASAYDVIRKNMKR